MRLPRLLITALFLTACSIDISEPTLIPILPTNPPPQATTPPAPAPSPIDGSPRPELTPTAIALTPVPAPLPWADLQLSGRLIFLTFTAAQQSAPILTQLDLASGAQTVLFQPPTNTWLSGAAVSPDQAQIVIAYAPPPPADEYQFGYTDLYVLPADGSEAPRPLLTLSTKPEAFFNPVWSPDGKYVYYVHLTRNTPDTSTYQYRLERIAFPDGQPEVIRDHASWPRLSPDGSTLAYVSFDPPNGVNDLYFSDSDGQNSRPALPPKTFLSVDAPFYSPDGSFLYFSATGDGSAPALSWVDQLLGVRPALANGAPADWWRIPAAGGSPQRLTEILDVGLYGAFSPDGGRIAFIAVTGLYVMNADGSGLAPLLNIANVGTVDWVP